MKKRKKATICAFILFGIFITMYHTTHESSFITIPIVTGTLLRKIRSPGDQYVSRIEDQPKVQISKFIDDNDDKVIPTNSNNAMEVHRYALSSSYWEQQTNAILNLYCFQRWADSVGLKVVEPFGSQSKLQFPDEVLYGHHNSSSNVLHFHDYVDIRYYNENAHLLGNVAALESWDKFLQYAGKKVIVLIMEHRYRPSGVYINDEIRASRHVACNAEMSLFYERHSKLMHTLQFEVVRNVCISIFKYSNVMSPRDFNSFLGVDSYPGDITLWVSEWRGIGTGRITFTGLREGEFYRLHGGKEHLLTMIRPSDRIISDSERYVRQVLGCDFDQYDAVVVRARPFRNLTIEQNLQFFKNCATELKQYLSDLRSDITFLSISLGRFGDMDIGNYFDHDSHGNYTGNGKKLFQQFLNIVYGYKSISSYDNDFVRATNGQTDSGYIATVQKTIATNARSLVVLGGRSSFQRSIIVNYKANKHTDIKYICYSEFD